MIWCLENILIPVVISLGFMWHSGRYLDQVNRYNNFKKHIQKIKNLLVLSPYNNFNVTKEAEITLAIDDLLKQLKLKNEKQHNKVKTKLDDIRRRLTILSDKGVEENMLLKTSALMVEELIDLHKEAKRKQF